MVLSILNTSTILREGYSGSRLEDTINKWHAEPDAARRALRQRNSGRKVLRYAPIAPAPARAYLLGFRRGLRKARTEYHSMAQSWEDELRELRDEFHQIAVSVHRERIDRAIDEAVIERSANPDALLH